MSPGLDGPSLFLSANGAPNSHSETLSSHEGNEKYKMSAEPEIDGDEIDPIVICGFSVKFPQDATTPEAFWDMLIEKRCAMTNFPASRLNVDGFFRKRNSPNTFPLRGGHFIEDDLSVFDAEFFGISPVEAAAMDPMQRWLLEATYHAFESAGIRMNDVAGSPTAVYTGCFGLDYTIQLYRDAENPPTYAAVGLGLSMLANRLSWFFDLRGPSIGLDSACSSSAMALDIACQSLRAKTSKMAIVAGCNLTFSPETYTWMSNINFLSPDSRCFSFDHRANGYARGEGVAVVLLKRLSDAIKDGNLIRAVIRSTGSNEDGKTPGITQPSSSAQERLIRETYRKASLSLAHTRYFEAHGTGTPIGDPREAQAIGMTFRKYRTDTDPLYVGAVKSNIGHLEGASGLAGVIKAILVLEKGIIPPNANFEGLNPAIDPVFLRLKFPEESHPWPSSGLRRASINSFGYGGSNSHLVLDDAYNYMRLRSLNGKHCTFPSLLNGQGFARTNGVLNNSTLNGFVKPNQRTKLLVWSAADRNGVDRIAKLYEHSTARRLINQSPTASFLENLAFTLDSKRTHLQWRSFSVINNENDLRDLSSRISVPVQRYLSPPRIGFVFTGQGAQWYAMGRELLCYSSFHKEVLGAEQYIKGLGCRWSLVDELLKSEEESRIDNPDISQVLCTVLQVAMVNLLRTFDVWPSGVIGHSSGEIAAAYACGYISSEYAWKLAYFRGLYSSEINNQATTERPFGAMMSVGLSADQTQNLISHINANATSLGLSIACVNSPKNVTVAGDSCLIDELKVRLDESQVFARKLRVTVAYHSNQMKMISGKYLASIGSDTAQTPDRIIPMISSVTGKRVVASDLIDGSYWVRNLVSPVLFSQAMVTMCEQSEASLAKKIDRSHLSACVVNHLVEIGPHAALQGPIREILRHCPRGDSIGYDSMLRRGKDAVETTLGLLGRLHCLGIPTNLRAANEPSGSPMHERYLLPNLPQYPFDHSQKYWHESRLSRAYRFRKHAPSDLLGVRDRDSTTSEPRWRLFVRIDDMPWTKHHVVAGSILYPAAGMLVLAIEAVKQITASAGEIVGYTLRNVSFESPINLKNGTGFAEIQTCLQKQESLDPLNHRYRFVIHAYVDDDTERTVCHGNITAELAVASDDWVSNQTREQRDYLAQQFSVGSLRHIVPVDSQEMYAFLKEAGLEFGPIFQGAKSQCIDRGKDHAAADITLSTEGEDDHVIHPASLDAIFHLSFTALTEGARIRMKTSVPTHLEVLWLSNTGLSSSDASSVKAGSKITTKTIRGFTCSGAALDADTQTNTLLWYDGLQLTNISHDSEVSDYKTSKEELYLNVESKVALDRLTTSETKWLLEERHPSHQNLDDFFQDAGTFIKMCLRKMLESVSLDSLKGKDNWRQQYWSWADYHVNLNGPDSTKPCQSDKNNEQHKYEVLRNQLGNANHVGRLYVEIASKLEDILVGDYDPLELLSQTDLFKNYYNELTTYRCALQVLTYIDLLAHQNPGINILEVGGGTGAGTRNLVRMLAGNAPGSLRCNRYDFTDVSAAFLAKAREEFSDFETQMTFGTLDIERDFSEQGITKGAYDVVLALGVLHVTSNIAETIARVRKVLKPGGRLIMQESFNATGWTMGFVFGLFPGWWLGVEDGRRLSPSITVDAWDTILKSNGFSGAEIVLRDFDSDLAHHYGWIITTATEESIPPQLHHQPNWQGIFVVDEDSIAQTSFAHLVSSFIAGSLGMVPQVMNIKAAEGRLEKKDNELVIFLGDYRRSFLDSLDERKWKDLRRLVQKSRHIAWVTSITSDEKKCSWHAIVDGLARTLRLEYYELHLVTLALDELESQDSHLRSVIQIIREMIERAPHQPYEEDYTQVDGLLHTRRLVPAPRLRDTVQKLLIPYQSRDIQLGAQPQFTISMAPASPDKAPHYLEYVPMVDVANNGEVEVLVKAMLLDQSSATAAASNGKSLTPKYISGVVLDAGLSDRYEPGDHVVALCEVEFRSHIRLPPQRVARVPSGLSFSDACDLFPLLVTAYHLIAEVGRAQLDSSVLIINCTTPMGRATAQLASRLVSEVWTTAADEEESNRIAEELKVPKHRILPRSWFHSQPMLLSKWKEQFTIILSDSTVPLYSVRPCVQPSGKLIVYSREAERQEHTHSLSTPSASTNHISVFYVDLVNLVPTTEALTYGGTALANWKRNAALSGNTHYPASQLRKALEQLELGKERTLILDLDDKNMIKLYKKVQPATFLSGTSTYVVAGGLGGLGRAIVRWLIDHGARYIIVLSRSGPRTDNAQALVAEAQAKGVCLETPCCDISNKQKLEMVLSQCGQRMPAVKGCVQASMVMKESIFDNMGFDDWRAATDPKVKGSWNLHCVLPKGMDFFILVSSIQGILGTRSLAGYNAGNTFQDALAHMRVAHGERGTSLDLGAVVDEGYLTEHRHHIDNMRKTLKIRPILVKEIYAILEIFCNSLNPITQEPNSCQTVIGIRPPAYWQHLENPPPTMANPFWAHTRHLPAPNVCRDSGSTLADSNQSGRGLDAANRAIAAESLAEAAQIISKELVRRVSHILGTPEERLDNTRPMHSYGIDSLSALDIRNWVSEVFGVEMPVFEILGETSFNVAGLSLARKVRQGQDDKA